MGKPTIDLTGKVVGMVTVVGRSERQDRKFPGHIMWDCICVCGKKYRVRQDVLRNTSPRQRQLSCGCAHVNDLTGKRIGNIVVIESAGRKVLKKDSVIYFYKVKCDCGRVWTASRSYITDRRGTHKSCGKCHYALERRREIALKHGATCAQKKYLQGAYLCTLEEIIAVRWYQYVTRKVIAQNSDFYDLSNFHKWALSHSFTRESFVRRNDNKKTMSSENAYLIEIKPWKWDSSHSAFGYTGTWTFWSNLTGIKASTIRRRVRILGYSLEDAVTRPNGQVSKKNKTKFHFKWEQNKVAVKLAVDKIIAEEATAEEFREYSEK